MPSGDPRLYWGCDWPTRSRTSIGPSQRPDPRREPKGARVIAFPDAVRRIIDACGPLGTERIALLTSVGRVAAETIDAREDLVPFARSAMDGFAVRTSDLERTPVELPVSGRLYADSGETEHAPRTATAIATGAPIPRGADAVLPIERRRDPRRRRPDRPSRPAREPRLPTGGGRARGRADRRCRDEAASVDPRSARRGRPRRDCRI